jgi:tetrahydromethanopterin S-methyltransferase subunit A
MSTTDDYDGLIEAKVDGVDEVELNMNIATSEDIQPLKSIVELFEIPDVDEVGEIKQSADVTVGKDDSAEELHLQLVENQLPDLDEANTNKHELPGQVEVVETVIDSGANRCMFVNEAYFSDIPGTLAKGLAGAHFGEQDQMKLKNETVGC